MSYLKEIIRGRTVGLMVHGKSIEGLEACIKDINQDICWMSIGLFTTHEKYILSQVNRHLDIVFDCATVPEPRMHVYEPARLFRLSDFLARADANLWITTHGLIRDSVSVYRPYMLTDHASKIMQVDSLFPAAEIGMWMDVPNSTTLAIAAALAGGARRILIFGLDGYRGTLKSGVKSYYKPEYHQRERLLALGTIEDPGINRDTDGFEARIPDILMKYRALFVSQTPIYNVSPQSIYTVLPKISYSDVVQNKY